VISCYRGTAVTRAYFTSRPEGLSCAAEPCNVDDEGDLK
jgi:hypothetical protein